MPSISTRIAASVIYIVTAVFSGCSPAESTPLVQLLPGVGEDDRLSDDQHAIVRKALEFVCDRYETTVIATSGMTLAAEEMPMGHSEVVEMILRDRFHVDARQFRDIARVRSVDLQRLAIPGKQITRADQDASVPEALRFETSEPVMSAQGAAYVYARDSHGGNGGDWMFRLIRRDDQWVIDSKSVLGVH